MQILYHPNSAMEKFGAHVYDTLVENYPHTFFVGGMVRDLLMERPISDMDIATEATPDQVTLILEQAGITCDCTSARYGVITAERDNSAVEVTTMRTEQYHHSRFPKVQYVRDARQDSHRRDFTINALYFSRKTGDVLDFYHGQVDLKRQLLRTVGDPDLKFQEDPLRMVRVLRFYLTLQFSFVPETLAALKNNFSLIKKLPEKRIASEVNKISDSELQNNLKIIINNDTLDFI